MVRIFDYTDYRQYLKDVYTDLKNSEEGISFGELSERLGGFSRAYLHRIFSGVQPLALKTAELIAETLSLKKRESEYFIAMIEFARSRKVENKQYLFERMLTFRKNDGTTQLKSDQFEYFSKWYIVVIRELLATTDFRGDYEQLAELVSPPITAFQVEKAIEVLERLGIIVKNAKGRYVCKQCNLSTSGDFNIAKNLAVRQFQKEIIGISADMIELKRPEVRDFSTITASVSEEGFEKIRAELTACRVKISQIITEDKDVDRVYHLNLNLFPVSKLPKTKKGKTK
jgi:uncharacterized protein (TIGR02147 family)